MILEFTYLILQGIPSEAQCPRGSQDIVGEFRGSHDKLRAFRGTLRGIHGQSWHTRGIQGHSPTCYEYRRLPRNRMEIATGICHLSLHLSMLERKDQTVIIELLEIRRDRFPTGKTTKHKKLQNHVTFKSHIDLVLNKQFNQKTVSSAFKFAFI